MEITAKLNNLRIAPRKVRLAINLIKGLSVEEAGRQLKFLSKKSSQPVLKLLNSAIANAKHNFNLDKEGLYISKVLVNEGPPLRRSRPRAMGRAFPIMKRTSHIILTLGQREEFKELKQKRTRKPETEKRVKAVAPVIKDKEKNKETIKKYRPGLKRQETLRPKKGFFRGIKRVFRRKSL